MEGWNGWREGGRDGWREGGKEREPTSEQLPPENVGRWRWKSKPGEKEYRRRGTNTADMHTDSVGVPR